MAISKKKALKADGTLKKGYKWGKGGRILKAKAASTSRKKPARKKTATRKKKATRKKAARKRSAGLRGVMFV